MAQRRVTGRITELLVERHYVQIRLDNDPEVGPLENVFILQGALEGAGARTPNENFNALYSLAIAASANRWPITILIAGDGEISKDVQADVRSIAVGF